MTPILQIQVTDNGNLSLITFHRSAVHAHEWWVRDDLSGEQRLWTFSLKSALQCFESESWGPVPELPAAIIVCPSYLRLSSIKDKENITAQTL